MAENIVIDEFSITKIEGMIGNASSWKVQKPQNVTINTTTFVR